MKLVILAGSAHAALARGIARELWVSVEECAVEVYPDGERRVSVRSDVRGADVYAVQPTGPPVDGHLVELALLGDACRRAGAARLTSVVPYFGYARQDRRGHEGEPVGAWVASDLLGRSFDPLVVVDPHSASLEAMTSMRVETLTAVPLLATALRPRLRNDAVLVAPDLGAVHLAERYAELLELPVAIVLKQRISGEEVRAGAVMGDVARRQPVVVDDMISTGGTVEAAIEATQAAGAVGPPIVAATHGLFVGPAWERLQRAGVEAVFVTDSLPQEQLSEVPLEVVPLAPLIGDLVRVLHGAVVTG